MKYTDKEKDALHAIGYFYLLKAEGDYVLAHQSIEGLHIHRITYEGSELGISLGRPGVLIGQRGENIEKLGKALKEDLKDPNLHIRFNEDNLNDFLYPVDYSTSEYDYYEYDSEDYGEGE